MCIKEYHKGWQLSFHLCLPAYANFYSVLHQIICQCYQENADQPDLQQRKVLQTFKFANYTEILWSDCIDAGHIHLGNWNLKKVLPKIECPLILNMK